MSNVQTGAQRTPHDLSHFVMSAGKLGQLQTLSAVPVLAGDSFDQNLIGSLRLSQLRRGLAVDSHVDIFTFYIPYRHVYGDAWIQLMKDGIDSTPIDDVTSVRSSDSLNFLGLNTASQYKTLLLFLSIIFNLILIFLIIILRFLGKLMMNVLLHKLMML
jgi:hypothetical protein